MSARVMGMLLADNGATVIEVTDTKAAPAPAGSWRRASGGRGKAMVDLDDVLDLSAPDRRRGRLRHGLFAR
jgi:crotonobetainyl-CoA:carnitine CoA-transferase CaiB-like acyl-CoA transferase